MHRILVAAVAGLIAGLILHRGLGLRFFGTPVRNEAAAPPAGAGVRGAVEAQKLEALHDQRQDELQKRLAAAEQDCADLRAKAAAAPKTPRAPTREEKVRQLGRMITRMVRAGAGKGGGATAEMQKQLTDFMKLCTELNVDMTNSTTMFRNPEFMGGLFEGVLDEAGIAGNEAARDAGKAKLIARPQALGEDPSNLKVQKAAAENLLDFYDGFGKTLFEKDPALARQMSAMSSGAAVSMSQNTRARAAAGLVQDVATAAKLDDATKARIQPVADRWAAEYAAALAEATQTHGQGFLDAVLTTEKLPDSNEAALARIRATLQFRGRLIDLELRALDEMAGQMDPESAARLKTFDKLYYFKRITDP